MSIVQLDPVALKKRYDALVAEAEKIKRVLDMLPELEEVARGGAATLFYANPTNTAPQKPSLTPAQQDQPPERLRAVHPALYSEVRSFVLAFPDQDFTVPDVITWLTDRDMNFDGDRERDNITLALRHLAAEGLVVVKVQGIGRRLQVYAKTEKGHRNGHTQRQEGISQVG